MATRRVTRRAPLVSGLAPLAQSISRTMSQRNIGYGNPRPATIPQNAYVRKQRTPITGGYGTTLVDASGAAFVRVGPAGVGTIWYPQAVAIGTTSGANDGSTCVLYLGPLLDNGQPQGQQIGGQSYAGGGDVFGVAIPPMWPGYFVGALWAGGTTGDLAFIQIYGDMDTLLP